MVTIWPYLSCILTIGTGKQPTVRADIFHSPSNSLSIPFANNTHRSKLRPQGRGLLRSGCRKRPAAFSGKRAAWRPGLDFCKMVVPSAMRSVISEAPVPGNDRASFSSCGCGRRNSARLSFVGSFSTAWEGPPGYRRASSPLFELRIQMVPRAFSRW